MLTRPTLLDRRTVTPSAMVIVPPDLDPDGVPVAGCREVRIITPVLEVCAGRQVYLGIDQDPSKIGTDMTYKMVPVSPNLPIHFRLRPEQFVIAAVDAHEITLAVFVEFHEEPA